MNIDSEKLLELAEKMRCTDDRQHSEYRRGTAVASDMLKDAIQSGKLASKRVKATVKAPADRNITSHHKLRYADPDDPDGPMIAVDPSRCAAELSVNKRIWPSGGAQCSARRKYGPEGAYCGNHVRYWERVEK